ncbi:hypothetical protein E2C01_101978 [Portunus trituberculatus]|uniref:Uncharacterized protein n=1 Tax=Portunus trituberculatus TaxID=210409 RepID=A0A5B7KN58_PORTR|nr:hypothetical protein [Portunus trituberculatus]
MVTVERGTDNRGACQCACEHNVGLKAVGGTLHTGVFKMVRLAVIWMVVSASVSFAATKEYFLSSTVHGICVPLSIQTGQTTYHTVSRILCAMLCAQEGAPKFSFTSE